jgi:hypothetical protein
VIYDLYSIKPSIDSAQVRLPAWQEQSRGAFYATWRVIEASPRHFRQPHEDWVPGIGPSRKIPVVGKLFFDYPESNQSTRLYKKL